MAWEVDWGHPENTGNQVWARDPDARMRVCREWHWTKTATLRRAGVRTPTYRADSWEVDWAQRKGKLVWARNPLSKMPTARDWHWVDFHTIERSGAKWKPKSEKTGRYITDKGYVRLTRVGMTEDDIQLADEHGLWSGGKTWRPGAYVQEHQLAAVKKYGRIPHGHVVRHINGQKADNRPENIVLGTSAENTMDHNTARVMAMYWREKYEEAMGVRW